MKDKPWKTYQGRDSAIGGLGRQPLGDFLSSQIIVATGKQPCGLCRKIRDTINRVEAAVKSAISI